MDDIFETSPCRRKNENKSFAVDIAIDGFTLKYAASKNYQRGGNHDDGPGCRDCIALTAAKVHK